MDASEIYPRRVNAKEVLIAQKGEEFVFQIADGTAKLSGRDHEIREPTLRREKTVRSGDWQKFKRLDRITCGQKYGPILAKERKDEINNNGRTRSQNSRTREEW